MARWHIEMYFGWMQKKKWKLFEQKLCQSSHVRITCVNRFKKQKILVLKNVSKMSFLINYYVGLVSFFSPQFPFRHFQYRYEFVHWKKNASNSVNRIFDRIVKENCVTEKRKIYRNITLTYILSKLSDAFQWLILWFKFQFS